MEKKFIYILMAGVLAATSCRKYVEIGVPGKQVLTYTSDYQDLLNTSTNVEGSYYYPVLASDDIDWQDSNYISKTQATDRNAYTWANDIVGDNNEDNDWATMWKAIYYSNTVIDGVMSSQKGTTAQKQNVLAQGYVNRAIFYYFLVNDYAKQYNASTAKSDLGMPMVTEPDLFASLNRASVQSTYDLILSDLNKAVPYLKDNAGYNNLASKKGAYGLLARVYLQMSDYTNAQKFADSALSLASTMDNLGDYTASMIGYPTIYLDPEILFEKKLSYASPTLPLSQSLISLYDTTDLRYQYFTEPGTNFSWTAFSIGRGYSKFKHITPYGYVNVGPTVPEMYLIKAECEARANKVTAAMADVNAVRIHRFAAANYKSLSATDTKSAMAIVIAERRREMVGTGMRLFDLKRYNLESEYQTTYVHQYGAIKYTMAPNDSKYVLPIATKYINLNPELKQNER